MSKIIRSARGEVVDFDLLLIKEQISSAPPPVTIAARQNFIDNRLSRRSKRIAEEISSGIASTAPVAVGDPPISIPDPASEMIEEIESTGDSNQIKQKAKKKVEFSDE